MLSRGGRRRPPRREDADLVAERVEAGASAGSDRWAPRMPAIRGGTPRAATPPRGRRASDRLGDAAPTRAYSSMRLQTKSRSQPARIASTHAVGKVAERRERAHLEIVGEDRAPKSERLPQQVLDPSGRERGREPVRPRRVRDHDGARLRSMVAANGARSRASSSGSRAGRGRLRCVSRSARPRPGKCLTQPPTPSAWSPSRNSSAALDDGRRLLAGAPAARTRADAPGISRSTTGAKSTSKPNARHDAAGQLARPGARGRRRRVAKRDGRTEDPRNRSTGPPSWSTQRGGEPGSARSSAVRSSSARAVPMLRRKRTTAPGGSRSRMPRSWRRQLRAGDSDAEDAPVGITRRPPDHDGALRRS